MALLGVLTAGGKAADARQLSETERRVADRVDALLGEAVGFLEQVVNVNSGTMHLSGVREVGRLFDQRFRALGMETSWEAPADGIARAGNFYAEVDGGSGKRLLLIGHLDTVFEEDSPFQRWERLDERWAKGPGTEDMKGGNVVILYALKALQAEGLLDGMRIVVALTGDEESTGRPLSLSRRSLIEAARRSDVALGFEGMVDTTNNATVARRGYTGWTLRVRGRQGHSSLIFGRDYGAGAVFETARILDRFYGEIRGEEYLTFGAGVLLAGTEVTYDAEHSTGTAFGKGNVIPNLAVAEGDLRTISADQTERIKQRMEAIVAQSLPGTSAEIVFDEGMPPMAPTAGNYRLLDVLSGVSSDLGFGPVVAVDPGLRGAGDISFASGLADCLDGLGVLGAGGHSNDERIDLYSLPIAIKRAAVLIYRLSRE